MPVARKMSGLSWFGRALFGGGGGGAAEDAGRAAQPGTAPPAAAHGGALDAAAASGAERASPARPAAPGALLPPRSTPRAVRRLAQTPPADARLAADAPARRALLTEDAAAGAEPEAPDFQAQPDPPSSPRASPRLAERGGKLKDAGKAPAAAAAPCDAPGVPRTVQQLRKKHDAHAVSPNFPTGPWETADDALAEINVFTKKIKTDGGGFAVTWGSSRAGVTSGSWARGRQKKLVCHEHGPPHKCKWNLWLEHCVEGWVIKSFSAHDNDAGIVHNHALAQSQEEANARPAMRSIPEKLLPLAKRMVEANMTVASVYRWLCHEVKADGDEVAFNYQDVYHATGASTKERMMDATNLVETLRRREQEEGLFFRSQTDSEGCLTNVFYAMRGAHEIYAVDVDHQVVELDTKVRCFGHLWPLLRAARNGVAPAVAASHAVARRCAPCSTAPTMRG